MRSMLRMALCALLATLGLGALTATPALAAGKPFVETKPATNITETSATLNGIVDPNGAETKYYFEYGTTTKYGKKTAEASAGSGTSFLEESSAITKLTGITEYHFRIVATNANGTTDGSDLVLLTTPKAGLPEFVHGEGGGFPIAIEGKAPEVLLRSELGPELNCRGYKVKGEVLGAKTASLSLKGEECVALGTGGERCYSEGASPWNIILSGTASLVYVNKAAKQVALVLGPIGKTEIKCKSAGVNEFTIAGRLIIPITPINTATTKYTATFRESKKGRGQQEFIKYETEKSELAPAFMELDWGEGEGYLAYISQEVSLTASKSFTIDA